MFDRPKGPRTRLPAGSTSLADGRRKGRFAAVRRRGFVRVTLRLSLRSSAHSSSRKLADTIILECATTRSKQHCAAAPETLLLSKNCCLLRSTRYCFPVHFAARPGSHGLRRRESRFARRERILAPFGHSESVCSLAIARTHRVPRPPPRFARRRARATHLIIHQPPLLQKRMHPHNRPNIPCQIPPARRHRQILARIQPIRVHHEIPVILVNRRRLASVLAAEEFRQGASFEWVNGRE